MRALFLLVSLLAAPLAAAQPAEPGEAPPQPAPEPAPAAEPAAPTPASFEVKKVVFRGNRKVEDDALRVNLRTVEGATLTADMLREDVRSIWRTGFFEDVQVETTTAPDGVIVIFALKEKPSVRKIYVTGHEEVGLSKVNEVLDLKREQILDLAKVKKNAEKIREVYVQRGFYMADVPYEIRRVSPNEVDIYFRVQENSKVEVRRVNFVGNKAVPDEELRAVMLTQEAELLSFVTSAGTYREDAFQRDLLLIQSHYMDRGYVNAKVGEPKLELSPDKRSLYITISIDEGEQYRIGRIDVQGDLLEKKTVYTNRISSKTGELFNKSKLGQDMQELTDLYKDRGFAYVNVAPNTNVDDKARTVDIVFEIQKGSEVYFERINIRGNTKTRDKVVRRELRVYEGDLYNQTRLDLSKRRATALGFFDRVDLSTKRGESDDKMEVNIEVAERQTGAFQVGAGFSSVESFILQAQISQNNLFGRGQLLQLQAQLSGLRRLFMLQFEEPYFLDTNWTFGFNLFNQLRYYYSFTRQAYGGSLTWGYMLVDDLRLFLTYTLEDVNVDTSRRNRFYSVSYGPSLPQGSLANLVRSGLTSSARVSLSYDTRDNRLFTRSGWYNQASVDFAEPAIFSENQFTRYDATVRYFYPLWGPFVLRLKGEMGLIQSRDPQGVPIFERYFVGGIFDVRGFRPYSLSPQIRAPQVQAPDTRLENYKIGGNLQVVGKAEIEFPIIEKVGIRAVFFSDVGNAYNLEDQYCRLRPANPHPSVDPCQKYPTLNNLRASWGFGFRWFSPIGPLRFEWGLPFRPLPGEESVVFEFTIGNDL